MSLDIIHVLMCLAMQNDLKVQLASMRCGPCFRLQIQINGLGLIAVIPLRN